MFIDSVLNILQGFGIRTRTDVALGLLGVLPLESEVDFKKLNLLGQLCRNDTHCWIIPVFREPNWTNGIVPRYNVITEEICLI